MLSPQAWLRNDFTPDAPPSLFFAFKRASPCYVFAVGVGLASAFGRKIVSFLWRIEPSHLGGTYDSNTSPQWPIFHHRKAMGRAGLSKKKFYTTMTYLETRTSHGKML